MNVATPIEARRERSGATRRRLIDATIEAIATHGLAKTTIATVAQISGLSPGLVGFHFRSKNQLVMESLAHLIEKWRAGWLRIAANARMSPAERLRAILDREFSPAWCNQRTVAIWYGFWGGVPTQPAHRQMCRDAELSQTLVLADHFRLLIQEGGYRAVDPDAAAQGLSALMMGMYLTYGFDPEHFDRQNAKRTCVSYLAGLFPQHFSQPWKLSSRPGAHRANIGAALRTMHGDGERRGVGDSWTVDAEYGRLCHVLVAQPASQIPASAPRISKAVFYGGALASEAGIRAEHRALCDLLLEEQIHVHSLTPDPQLPLQTCVQNVGLVTPFGAIVVAFREPWRSGETVPLLRFYETMGITVWNTVTAGTFDGGNALLIRPGAILLACSAAQDSIPGAAQVARWFEEEGWETRTVLLPQPLHRLDSVLCVVSETHALACRQLLAPEIADWIEQHGFELIDLDHPLDLEGAGFLSLGNGKVLASAPSNAAAEHIRAAGLEIVETNVQSFACLGIGLRQLVHPLHRVSAKR